MVDVRVLSVVVTRLLAATRALLSPLPVAGRAAGEGEPPGRCCQPVGATPGARSSASAPAETGHGCAVAHQDVVPVERAVRDYSGALLTLSRENEADADQRVLRTLLARDRVAYALRSAGPEDAGSVIELACADRTLKAAAPRLDELVGHQALERWRQARQPRAEAWWWSLDEPWAVLPAWNIAVGVIATVVGLGLTVEVTRRTFGQGPSSVGTLLTLTAFTFSALAGSVSTHRGRQVVQRLLDAARVRRRHHHYGRFGIAVLLLVCVFTVNWLIAPVAREVNNCQQEAEARAQTAPPSEARTSVPVIGAGGESIRCRLLGLLTGAGKPDFGSRLRSYELAIRLDPDLVEAHFNLGDVYEDMLQYDRAISTYQMGLQLDSDFLPHHNNLARLLIVHRKDYAGAVSLLNRAIEEYETRERATPDLSRDRQWKYVGYTLHKNRGWAYLGLGLPDLVNDEVRIALLRYEAGAGVHCLLAQALEAQAKGLEGRARAEDAQSKVEQAQNAWRTCLVEEAASAGLEAVEPDWLALAQARTRPGRTL